MKNFTYAQAADPRSALSLQAGHPAAKFLGGGTNLVDLMRENIEQPECLIDVTHLSQPDVEELPNGGLRISAAMRNSHLASHPLVQSRYPVLSQAILNGASGQLRNMATTAGNLMQRTRCYYFYDGSSRCNKRSPGSGCDAIDGFNRIHAILGASPQCIATHPSDMCVALAALNAEVRVTSAGGDRSIPFADFHRLPGETPHIETDLRADELITAVDLPPLEFARRSIYRKVRDRASYAFAIVSVAAALEIKHGVITRVHVALGGVAHKPWRARAAEQSLIGQPANEVAFERAAQLEVRAAVPHRYNGFKIGLATRTLVGVLTELSERGDSSGEIALS